MRHSNISKVYFGAPRAYRYIGCEQTRTRTRATRAHAHESKQSMYRIATQERIQNMPRIVWGVVALHNNIYYNKKEIPK